MRAANTAHKLSGSIAAIIALSLCLVTVSFALVYATVSVEGNIFRTATVKINLNDGKPVVSDDAFLFEPGMTVKQDFFLINEGTCEVYYKFYFQNVSGGLADCLEVTITEGERILYQGTPKSLSRDGVGAAEDVLGIGERRDLQIYFHLPADVGNQAQNLFLTFDFAADAVQVKNNTDKTFE